MRMAKDWKDGLLSIVMRGMSKNFRDQGYYEYQTTKWVILDGDIDALWIESMNTVMDDNKVHLYCRMHLFAPVTHVYTPLNIHL